MITGIAEKQAHLTAPRNTPDGQVWRYGVGFPFQVAPGLGGVLAAIEVAGTGNYGHLNGSDLLLFQNLSTVADAQTFVVSRNEYRKNPTTGKPEFLLKSPMFGGFLPLGATKPDGTLYPHGGTGFGICQSHIFPDNDGKTFVWWDSQRRDLLETSQFSYDGKEFAQSRPQTWGQTDDPPLRIGDSGWRIISHGLTMAIPDNGTLLLPVLAATLDNSSVGVGVVRWEYTQGVWEPVSFMAVETAQGLSSGTNVAEKCPWFEPSLARDADGSLFFSARSQCGSSTSKDGGYPVYVWRSVDQGITWNLIIHSPCLRNDSPVSINGAVNGNLYISSNPLDPERQSKPQAGRGREILMLWPVNTECSGLEPPLVIRDALQDFGPPPVSPDPDIFETWMVDHPNAATLELADGQLHSVLAYRVMHSPPYRPSGTLPAAASGCYLAELLTDTQASKP